MTVLVYEQREPPVRQKAEVGRERERGEEGGVGSDG